MKKDRISVSIDRETRLKLKEAATVLNISESKYGERAIEAELENFNHRKEMVKAQEIAVKHLEDKVQAEEERDAAKEELKQVASHLGVPDTSQHCKQRIDELQASIVAKEAELAAYREQSFLGRLFRSVPKSVPSLVEMEE